MSILITGSRKGLGKALAECFKNVGYEVVRHSRSEDAITLSREAGTFICCDLLSADEIEAELERLTTSKISVSHLICNAGKSSYKTAGFDPFRNLSTALQDNLLTSSNMIYATLQKYSNDLKTITIIGSICGEETILGAPLEYSVAKAALKSFTKLSSRKLSDLGIRVNLITPGNLFFDGSVWERKKSEDEEAYWKYLETNVPMKAIGDPSDIFHAIKFLISEDAKFINGANLVIDGGQLKRW